MSTPMLEFGGWVLRAPVTVGTNLLLASQALWLVAALEAGHGPGDAKPRPWTSFLRLLELATAVGAVKHGTASGSVHEAARIVSGLATGAAVAVACVATIRARMAPGLATAALEGLVYLLPLRVGVWVDSTDLAHSVLFLALPLLARADGAGSRT